MGNCATTVPNEHIAIKQDSYNINTLSQAQIENNRLKSQLDKYQQQLYHIKEENEWNELIRPHQVTRSITKIPSQIFKPPTSTTMKWQWKADNDKWVEYDSVISNKIEFLSTGECVTFTSKDLDRSAIIRTGSNSAVHTMQIQGSQKIITFRIFLSSMIAMFPSTTIYA